MTNPNRVRRRFTPQQKEEAVALCLAEGLTCTAVAQRLGIPVSSLAKWVRQARIDRGELATPGQGPLTSVRRRLDRRAHCIVELVTTLKLLHQCLAQDGGQAGR